MFSSTTVESSTSLPIASAKPPSVMILMVPPESMRPKAPARIDSGIDRKIAKVERKLPRNTKIMSEASTEPEIASCSKASTALRTYVAWLKMDLSLIPFGIPVIFGKRFSTPSTIAIVFEPLCLRTGT